MRRKLFKYIVIFAPWLAWAWLSSSHASPADVDYIVLAQAGEITEAEAKKIAQKKHGGKAIGKVTKKAGVYRVKLVFDSGRVKTVVVDATKR